jgi:hypothetical protein
MKKLKDTKFGQFLAQKLPDAIELVGDILPDKGGLGLIKNIINRGDLTDDAKKEVLEQFHAFELEMYQLQIEDLSSARAREVDIAKTGRTDWLMYAAGVTALGTFILMVIAVIFIKEVTHNPLFHQLMGIIEGVALTVFAYYFGTSKSSSEKNDIIKKLQ